MAKLSPLMVAVFVYMSMSFHSTFAQNCDNPQLLCAESGQENISTSDGTPVALPVTFCFSNADNAVFFEFNTADNVTYPNINFDDNAQLSISSIVCDPDTNLSQTVNIAVFSAAAATDACDATSFDTPIYCDIDLDANANVDLSGLAPATTYYVLVSGSDPVAPGTGAGLCDVSVSVTGPAVSYDLEAEGYPEGSNPMQAENIDIDEGATAVLAANDVFPNLTWSGEALDGTSGTPVNASPEGVGETFTYTVQSEIDGCVFTDEVNVTIVIPIDPYNAFTPNGDGINDTWEIRKIQNYPNAQITVFSRWGQKVFQAVNYSNDWGGDDLPTATYYYVIELNPIEFNVEPITGSVTIVR